ncbi:uncharacterized protein BO72DRAFT_523588 [Aspergillus fijiensis CBS 313.89]|uniref:Uncharacterized protein n=1 Tax=Aspergillus fijiensis CBS 313.89 TaxID=1448319 RepID=A0A8G1S017_9EURO|nr:uncharacterized protein BO72DRAFT_523588 [Aspergillus fijiensis CBS 313.89]RAK82805.1 hypothetical protein BO72DRAFT_523588 [Aspergillus fijiensis CBS 313.89]
MGFLSSGDSFATHLLFGTSRVLSLLEREREPTRPLSPSLALSRPTKSLVDAFATLESHRAILYGDKATLAPAADQLFLPQPDPRGREILDLSGPLLADTDLPAVLLLFPVRMAGAHASGNHARDRVLGTIGKIRHKGFLVADRIEVDLQEA